MAKRVVDHQDRKSTRLNSSHTVIYTLSLHDALPIFAFKEAGITHKDVDHLMIYDAFAHLPLYGQTRRRSSRSEEHTSELQSHSDLHSFPTRRSSDLRLQGGRHHPQGC